MNPLIFNLQVQMKQGSDSPPRTERKQRDLALTQSQVRQVLSNISPDKSFGMVKLPNSAVANVGFAELPYRVLHGNMLPHVDNSGGGGGTTLIYLEPSQTLLTIQGITIEPVIGERVFIPEGAIHSSIVRGSAAKVVLGPYNRNGRSLPPRKANMTYDRAGYAGFILKNPSIANVIRRNKARAAPVPELPRNTQRRTVLATVLLVVLAGAMYCLWLRLQSSRVA